MNTKKADLHQLHRHLVLFLAALRHDPAPSAVELQPADFQGGRAVRVPSGLLTALPRARTRGPLLPPLLTALRLALRAEVTPSQVETLLWLARRRADLAAIGDYQLQVQIAADGTILGHDSPRVSAILLGDPVEDGWAAHPLAEHWTPRLRPLLRAIERGENAEERRLDES